MSEARAITYIQCPYLHCTNTQTLRWSHVIARRHSSHPFQASCWFQLVRRAVLTPGQGYIHLRLRGTVLCGNWKVRARGIVPPAAGWETRRTNHYESSDTGSIEGGYPTDQMGQAAQRHPGGHGGGGYDAGGVGFEGNDPRPIRSLARRPAAIEGGGPVELLPSQAVTRRDSAQFARSAAKHGRAAPAECDCAQGCSRATVSQGQRC